MTTTRDFYGTLPINCSPPLRTSPPAAAAAARAPLSGRRPLSCPHRLICMQPSSLMKRGSPLGQRRDCATWRGLAALELGSAAPSCALPGCNLYVCEAALSVTFDCSRRAHQTNGSMTKSVPPREREREVAFYLGTFPKHPERQLAREQHKSNWTKDDDFKGAAHYHVTWALSSLLATSARAMREHNGRSLFVQRRACFLSRAHLAQPPRGWRPKRRRARKVK